MLLAIAWVRILLVADFGEADSGPTMKSPAREGPEMRNGPGGAIAALGWAGLAAEATRTDTLIWYATEVLKGVN